MPPQPGESTIPDDAKLWRRIPPNWEEPLEGRGSRPASIAFRDRRTGEVSVHIASLTTPSTILAAYPGVRLAEIAAGLVRSVQCDVVRDPTEDDPSHAVIRPSPTKSGARMLARAAIWVRVDEGPV